MFEYAVPLAHKILLHKSFLSARWNIKTRSCRRVNYHWHKHAVALYILNILAPVIINWCTGTSSQNKAPPSSSIILDFGELSIEDGFNVRSFRVELINNQEWSSNVSFEQHVPIKFSVPYTKQNKYQWSFRLFLCSPTS